MFTETVSDKFTRSAARLSHSWHWLRTDFAEEFRQLLADGADRDDSGNEILWNTKHKYTVKIRTSAGRDVALKRYRKLRFFPYVHHRTPVVAEALNYQRFLDLGLPMAQLLAVGDTRHFFRPVTSFIVTEFAANCLDGRPFSPGGELEHETAWRDEFTRRNFALLAKVHDAGIWHRGFTPANELWRKSAAPDASGDQLEIVWIDVAGCRKISASLLRQKIPDDFVNFLRFYRFSPEEIRSFLQVYCDAVKVVRYEPAELFAEVERRLELLRSREAARA